MSWLPYSKSVDNMRHYEEQICKAFLHIYNANLSTNHQFIRHGNDRGESDCICSDELNIEIVSAYYNQEEAEKHWEFLRDNITAEQYNERGKPKSVEDWHKDLFNSIRNEISKKINKDYNYTGKLILVVKGQSMLINKEILDEYIKTKPDFSNKVFSEIWLFDGIRYQDGNLIEGIVRLDKQDSHYTILYKTVNWSFRQQPK